MAKVSNSVCYLAVDDSTVICKIDETQEKKKKQEREREKGALTHGPGCARPTSDVLYTMRRNASILLSYSFYSESTYTAN
jgi:hypothetical protein